MMNMSQSISQRLTCHSGWVPMRDDAPLAFKMFQTAVGPKQAQAYLESWGAGRFVLTGQYYSEGQNVLATLRLSLDETMDGAQLDGLVQQFVRKVDSTVADTYAVRLL